MGANSFGRNFTVTTFGESHGEAIGAIIDGIPSNFELDLNFVQTQLDKRRPGQSSVTTARSELDKIKILSGLFEGKTTGAPLAFIIENTNTKSGDYSQIKDCFRPSHADFGFFSRFGIRDYRGGGRSSGRETASRVACGAIAQDLLRKLNIEITASTIQIGEVCATTFDKSEIEKNAVRCADKIAAAEMEKLIKEAHSNGDSVGAVVECKISGIKAGIGNPIFEKVDALLAQAMLSIGAVKGIEFGVGFLAASMYGSIYNDMRSSSGYLTNHGGGIEGGITNGNEIVFRVVVKPTPSIYKTQQTVDINGNDKEIEIVGRHDPCIAPRIVPVIEAMSALVIIDLIMSKNATLKVN